MLKTYPKFKRGEVEKVFKDLSDKEKKLIKDYLEYRQARGITTKDKVKDVRRFLLQLRVMIEKDYDKLDLQDLRQILSNLTKSDYSEYYKNNIKADLKNFLKYLFNDWSLRFSNFEDLRFNSNARNEEKLNSSTLITKEEVDKLIKHETKLYWKAFLLLQYEAGLRTKETRFIKWSDIIFNVDDEISEIKVFSTKTKKSRTLFIKEATHYLKLLKEEQENNKEKGVYVFHARKNLNEPIHKSNVNLWFRRLTKKVLGVTKWNYQLRHCRATELYRLAKQNKIAKDTAIEFMGHSGDMSKTYTHLDKQEVKNMLKNQVYKIEDLPPEKKDKLEKEIEELKKENKEFKESLKKIERIFKELASGKLQTINILDDNDEVRKSLKIS